MSATIQQYLVRNEYTTSVDASVNVIELGHTSSLIRPFDFGTNWNELWIYFSAAISGSPATGNMTSSYYFFGLCSGAKRFSQNSGSIIGTHAIGIAANSATGSITLTGTTNATTNPINNNIHFSIVPMPYIIMATGSIIQLNTGAGIRFPRFETQFSSSAGPLTASLGNNFANILIKIVKGNTWVVGLHYAAQSIVAPSSSINIPNAVFKGIPLYGGGANLQAYMAKYPISVTGGGTNASYWSMLSSWTIPAGQPNTGSFGDFDSLNFYWRNTAYPNSKLLIRNLMVVRMA